MNEEIIVQPENYDGPNARLNVTVNGQNGDYPDALRYDMADGEVKRVATEAIRTGYIPGIAEAEVNFNDFVVDRFPATNELPPRLMLRPKTPFGEDSPYRHNFYQETPVDKFRRGDVVIAIKALDESAARVHPGTLGVVFEESNAYRDQGGPMVRWMNMGVCNVYEGQVKKVNS